MSEVENNGETKRFGIRNFPGQKRTNRDRNTSEKQKQKENSEAVLESRVIAINGKAKKGKCSKGESCSFCHDVETATMRVNPLAASLVSKWPTRNGRNNFSNQEVPLVDSSRSRVESISRKLARIHRVTIGILPSVKSTDNVEKKSVR